MEHQGAPESAKRAKNKSFENEDFSFNEDLVLEDFYVESPNKKVSPIRGMKHEIKVQEIEEIDYLKKKDIIKMPEIEDVLKSEKDDNGNDNIFKD